MKRKTKIFTLFLVICFLPITMAGCKKGKKELRTGYNIVCEIENGTVTGKETVSFYNCYETSFNKLKFNLFANAFRKGAKYNPVLKQYKSQCYYNGESYGNTEILSVSSGKELLNYAIEGEDENILTVELKKEVYPEERAEIVIEFKTVLAEVIARTGITEHTINLANFYPILCVYDESGFYECVYYNIGDPFYSDCADYSVTITYDGEYNVATSGYLVEATDGTKKTDTYKIENARSFAIVMSKEFEMLTDNLNGTQINYYYYKDESPKKSLEYAVKSLTLFSKLYGEYPYKTYSVVETGFMQGGMEFPALTFISDELEPQSYGEVIVHETAHQWWQTVVGNNEIEYGFLDEGLSEYSVVIFYENYPEYGLNRNLLIKASENTYKTFCTVEDKLFGKVNTVMVRSLKDFNGEYEYVNMAYVKPCIMFDTLRVTIGEEKFFDGLKNYFANYRFKNAIPDGLKSAFIDMGVDVNGFFDGFFNGKAVL